MSFIKSPLKGTSHANVNNQPTSIPCIKLFWTFPNKYHGSPACTAAFKISTFNWVINTYACSILLDAAMIIIPSNNRVRDTPVIDAPKRHNFYMVAMQKYILWQIKKKKIHLTKHSLRRTTA